MNVLVVVDMQKDFVSGALGSSEAITALENVASLIENFDGDEIIFTLDTHSGNYLNTKEGKALPVEHCIFGTEGWELEDKVKEAQKKFGGKIQCVTKKTFGSEDLFNIIRKDYWISKFNKEELNVEFVGVCSDICVVSNVLGAKAFCPNANISVRSNCCAGTTPENHVAVMNVMKSCQIEIIGG